MPKENLPFVTWVLAGITGVIFRDIYSLLIYFTGITNYLIWNVSADLFINTAQIHTVSGHILGVMSDFVIGGSLGVITGLIFSYLGPKDYLIKGLGIGLAAWALLFGILLHNLPHSSAIAPTAPIANISSFIEHAIFGIVTAWVIYKYVFQNTEQTEQDERTTKHIAKRYLVFQKVPDPLRKPVPLNRKPDGSYRRIKISKKF